MMAVSSANWLHSVLALMQTVVVVVVVVVVVSNLYSHDGLWPIRNNNYSEISIEVDCSN